MKTLVRLTALSVYGLVTFALLLFLPAGTLHYWQGWVFIAVFTAVTAGPTIYLARKNPAALQRRIHAGPRAETRPAQKVIITVSALGMFATLAFSAFDHRMGWSRTPVWVSVIGDVLVAAGLVIAMLVILQNSYAASTVQVEAGQEVVATGVYKYVRHPMYVGNVIMMVGAPLALGSYWGLIFILPGVLALVFRIRDEEKMLNQDLAGYSEYAQQVRYRLMPYVW